jgi:hypothetical protein
LITMGAGLNCFFEVTGEGHSNVYLSFSVYSFASAALLL